MHSLPPPPLKWKRGTIIKDQGQVICEDDTQDPLHAQETMLQLIIMVYSPESEESDVLAIHTIEMIPKSMILLRTV
jgi:hypothetical protein